MPGRARGFTLIEILVAVVIIGIVMSVAVLSLNLVGDDREVQREARRLMSLIEVAQDDAMLQGREFGLEFMTGAYRFVEYDPALDRWAEFFDDDYLQFWSLPEEMEFELFLEDQRVLLDPEPQEIATAEEPGTVTPGEQYTPHLLIFSSGDSTPFELHLVRRLDNLTVGIQGDLFGNLEIMTDDEIDR